MKHFLPIIYVFPARRKVRGLYRDFVVAWALAVAAIASIIAEVYCVIRFF